MSNAAIDVTVVASPSHLDDEQRLRLSLLRIGLAIGKEDFQMLESATAAAVAEFPEDVAVLGYRAITLERAGDLAGALKSVERAIAILRAFEPDAPEPPKHLYAIRRRIRSAIAQKDGGQ